MNTTNVCKNKSSKHKAVVNTKGGHEKLIETEKLLTKTYISNKYQLTKDLLNN